MRQCNNRETIYTAKIDKTTQTTLIIEGDFEETNKQKNEKIMAKKGSKKSKRSHRGQVYIKNN